jgi:hypothetical protein
MFNFWIWIIEKFNLFYGFEKEQITQSFYNLFGVLGVVIFIVSFVVIAKFLASILNDRSPFDVLIPSLIATAIISTLLTFTINYIYTPRDPESLIKTTKIKEEQTVIIPSEGVTATTLKLKDSNEQFQPSTLKEGDILTLTVTVGDKEFKKEFPYKKENLKIKKGKTDKVTSGVLLTRSFKDELFNHERIREEEDVVLELETSDPFSNASN